MVVKGLDDNKVIGRAITPLDEFREVDGMTLIVRDWTARVFMEGDVSIECVCLVSVDGKVLFFDKKKQIRAKAIRNIHNPEKLQSDDGRTFHVAFYCWRPEILSDGFISVTFLATVELAEE